MMRFSWLRKVLGPLAAAAMAGGAAAAPPSAPSAPPAPHVAKPAMWKFADADTTIYLFGSFHLLPSAEQWRTPVFEKALAGSDTLVLEVANLDDPSALIASLMKLAISPNLPPLMERVPAEKRDALKAMIADSGIPEAALDRMETWAAALLLTGVTYKRLGLDPNAGVEHSLMEPWRKTGKPLEGLETIDQQLGYFDQLSEDAQRKFLVGLLDSPEKGRAEFAGMLKAWETGDVAGIARTFDDETQMSAELRRTLMAERNARWSDWLKARLDKPGTVFVAVGAGHLAGNDSVVRLLAAKGLKVTRLQ